MILSMTGFGQAEAEAGNLAVRVEIRSVNHRFLHVRHRFPPELGALEPQVEALLRKKVARGAISISVNLERAATPGEVFLNVDVARRYKSLLVRAASDLGVANDLALSSLVQLPGVLGTQSDEERHRREARAVLRACEDAIAALIESRAVEGRSLQADLAKHAAAVARLVARIEKRIPRVVRGHMQALLRRIEELLGAAGSLANGDKVARNDLARELALIADRNDVSEEVARLKSHLDQLRGTLAVGGAVGRRLDFLVQELNREANTIGSKCNDSAVAHSVVELKTHIERVREQVQNVE